MKMKKFFTLVVLLPSFANICWAYDFSAVATSGQTLYYYINQGSNSVTVTYPGWNSYDPYDGYPVPTGALAIPSTVTYNGQTYSVSSIGERAFYNCGGLVSVTIPNSVSSIGNNAFYLVRNIVYAGAAADSPWGALCVNGYDEGHLVYADSSMTHLAGCSSAAISVSIPNTVVSIGSYAFSGCSGLTSVSIPNTVTSIGDGAFGYCSALKSVAIPNSVTSIGDGSFFNCSSLKSVTIGNSVVSIGDAAFYGCSTLTSVTFNAVNCAAMGSFSYPVFLGCSSMTALAIGDSVKTIPAYACAGCSALKSLAISNSVTSIGYAAFSNCSGLTSLAIPNSVTAIGYAAFSGCSGLTSVTIGDSVAAIGNYAFYGCNGLTSVTIPRSVETIGDYAFGGLERLAGITCKAPDAPYISNINAFSNIPDGIPVTIPCNSLGNYKYSYGWNMFSNFHTTMLYSSDVASADSSQGGVTIITQPTCENAQLQIRADASKGYQFGHWSDGNTDNPRYLELTGDTALLAYFVPAGSEEVNETKAKDIVVGVQDGQIVVENAAGKSILIFDSVGRPLTTESGSAEVQVFPMPAAGVYYVQVGDNPAQRVVVER